MVAMKGRIWISRLYQRRAALLVGAVWALFVLKTVFYASFVPLWEGFDEFSHFAVIQDSTEVSESLNIAPVPWTIRDWRPGWITQDEFWRLPKSERDRRDWALRALPRSPGHGEWLYEAQQPPLAYLLLAVP